MRGEVKTEQAPQPQVGITPACAGRSPRCAAPSSCSPDHPRVCGEKVIEDMCCSRPVGSPPRVRGEDFPAVHRVLQYRITPACAGRSVCEGIIRQVVQDHPRVCGEKAVVNPKCQSDRGSPPRVRGEAAFLMRLPLRRGITPACAGRSQKSLYRVLDAQDHPRVCGEKLFQLYSYSCSLGSPPRVRGEGSLCCARPSGRRITPACAGRSCTGRYPRPR